MVATLTSLSAKPTELKTKVNGSFCVVVILKFPLSSVKVPKVVPLIVTETAETTSLLLLFFTLPDTETDCCALATKAKMVAQNSIERVLNFLIRQMVLVIVKQNRDCYFLIKIFIFPMLLEEINEH